MAGHAYVKHFGSVGAKPTQQFFQTLSDGTLDDEDLGKIKSLRESTEVPQFDSPIRFGVPESKFEVLRNELKEAKGILVVPTKVHPILMKAEDRTDMYYVTTDTAWLENLSLLSYNFQMGSFSYPGIDADNWIQHYISTSDKNERMKLLRSLHFNILKNASIVPIEVAPFYGIAKPGWKLNQSKVAVGNDLWLIRRR